MGNAVHAGNHQIIGTERRVFERYFAVDPIPVFKGTRLPEPFGNSERISNCILLVVNQASIA
jgi:hypothetical protein